MIFVAGAGADSAARAGDSSLSFGGTRPAGRTSNSRHRSQENPRRKSSQPAHLSSRRSPGGVCLAYLPFLLREMLRRLLVPGTSFFSLDPLFSDILLLRLASLGPSNTWPYVIPHDLDIVACDLLASSPQFPPSIFNTHMRLLLIASRCCLYSRALTQSKPVSSACHDKR